MKNIYNVSKGQVLMIWIFGLVFWVWALAKTDYYSSPVYEVLLIVIPFAEAFYTAGWIRNQKNTH